MGKTADGNGGGEAGGACRTVVTGLSVLASVAAAAAFVKVAALPVGPSVLAAIAAGLVVYIGAVLLFCRGTKDPVLAGALDRRADDAVQEPSRAGRMTAGGAGTTPIDAPVLPPAPYSAAPVSEAAEPASATEPPAFSVAAAGGDAGQAPSDEDAAAPEISESGDLPLDPSDPLPVSAKSPDKALLMAVAVARANPTDRRPGSADARRGRLPPDPVKAPVKAENRFSLPPGRAPSRPSTTASPPAGSPFASDNGIDAAIARSRVSSEVMTGHVERLARPRGGHADDLKLIRGIGPKLEAILNSAGIWHFDQIATWKARDIAEIDAALTGFHGRITRDGWVKQARAFVAGAAPARPPRKPRAKKPDR